MSATQSVQWEELLELKTELATVVETLSILNEFIDNVFGAKFHSFWRSQTSSSGGVSSPLVALRDLRWKLSKSPHDTTSGVGCGVRLENTSGGSSTSRLPLIASPEIVNISSRAPVVKHEIECDDEVSDLLDTDPFGSEAGSTAYQTGERENAFLAGYDDHELVDINLVGYSLAQGHNSKRKGSDPLSRSAGPGVHSRFVPGLIPIQPDPDPLHDGKDYEESSPTSDDSSGDQDWYPSTADPKLRPTIKRKKACQKPTPHSSTDQMDVNNLKLKLSTQIRRQGSSDSAKEVGPFKCNLCPASYKQEDSLRSHQKYKHNPSRVQCQCPLCGKSMVDKYRLQRHLRLHTGEQPFSCEFCGQRFYRKDYHTKHMQRKHGMASSHTLPSAKPSVSSTSSTQVENKKRDPAASSKISDTRKVNKKVSHNKASVSSYSSVTTVERSESLQQPVIKREPQSTTQEDHERHTDYLGHLATTHHQGSTGSTALSSESKEQNSFLNYFAADNMSTNSTSSLVTMTSLTFDDLISADL